MTDIVVQSIGAQAALRIISYDVVVQSMGVQALVTSVAYPIVQLVAAQVLIPYPDYSDEDEIEEDDFTDTDPDDEWTP